MRKREKPEKKIRAGSFTEKVKDIRVLAGDRYVDVIIAAIGIPAVILLIIMTLEFLPDLNIRDLNEGSVTERNGNVVWAGMEFTPVTSVLKSEFNMPRKTKGMFVVNEGLGAARGMGIRAGDVLHSINRRHFNDIRSFVKIANSTPLYDGILLEVFRDGESFYTTFPDQFKYGPLMGPNKGHWQLGLPLYQKEFPYGVMTETQM